MGSVRAAYENQEDLLGRNREVPTRGQLVLLVLIIVEGWPTRPDLEGLRLLLALPDHGRRFRGHDSSAPLSVGRSRGCTASRPRQKWRLLNHAHFRE